MKQDTSILRSMQDELRNVARVLQDLPWWRWVIAALIIVLAITVVQTAGEFLVALQNRYATYPAGTDTNMYGRSGALAAILSLSAAWAAVFVLRMSVVRWYVPASLLFLSILGTIFYLPSWLEGVMSFVYIATIFVSFFARGFLLVPLIAVCIVSASTPSFVPGDWCKYELTMYRCPENIEYYVSPETGEKIIDRKQ